MIRARRRSKLSRSTQLKPLKYFCASIIARSAAELTRVNRNTAILFFHKLREVIFDELATSEPGLMGSEIEVDESYFGGHRIGKHGRGATGKVRVFRLLKRAGKIYVVAIPSARTDTLFPIIRDKLRPDSIVYTDRFGTYDVLDVSECHYVRINHSELFAEGVNHINGIENFWKQAKRHLRG